jgi:hypothetical protein
VRRFIAAFARGVAAFFHLNRTVMLPPKGGFAAKQSGDESPHSKVRLIQV